MHTISLLIIVILFGVLAGKNQSPYARAVVGSVFGIIFFCIWRFSQFYMDLYLTKEITRQIVFIGLVTVAASLSLALIRIKYYMTVASLSVALFIIAMILTFTLDIPVENEIAKLSGFYTPVKTVPFIKKSDERIFTQTMGRYTVAVPKDWQLHTDKGPYFPYFKWQSENRLLLEFRPRCFNSMQTSLPGIIMGYRNSNNVKKNENKQHAITSCLNDTSNKTVSCEAKLYQDDKQLKNISFFSLPANASKGIELDFVLQQNSPAVEKTINRVIESIKSIPGKRDSGVCLGLAEWM